MKFLILTLLIFLSALAHSAPLILSEVVINCPASASCDQRKVRFNNLEGEYRSVLHLKDTMKIVASDGGYQSFSYELLQENQKHKLVINFTLKPIIQDVQIGFTDRNLNSDPRQLINLKEGEFFEEQKFKDNLQSLTRRLESIGYPKNSHSYEVIQKNDKVRIELAITLGKPIIFKKIKTDTASSFVNSYLTKKFNNLYNRPFDLSKFKLSLDEAQKDLFTYGYYLISMDFKPIIKDDRVILDIDVNHDEMFAFDFKNLKRESRDVLLALMTDLFRQYKRPLSEGILKDTLKVHYNKLAYLNPDIRVETSQFRNKYKETVQLYRIYIKEGVRTKVSRVNFLGSTEFGEDKLRKYFDAEAFELASLGYYDEEFLSYFSDYIKNLYLKDGFVQAKVTGPHVTIDPVTRMANVEYVIAEGRRAFVREIFFSGVGPELEERLRGAIVNKTDEPFNPIEMANDIKKVATFLQEEGYYFAEVTNSNEDNIVRYSKSGADVTINYLINTGPMVTLNRILYLGNDKTRKKVLQKRVQLEEGEIITPSKTRDIEASLSQTGLFNSVSVTPVRHTSSKARTDVIVKLVEREYGLVEVAPGYRTDLGLKLTGTVSYFNLGGLNRSLSLRSQVNQRLSYQSFDPRRRQERKSFLEHNNTLTYNQSDLFDTQINLSTSLSYQVRRFYSFDAEIKRYNVTFTRDLTKRTSTSLRYQYEDITQWDATSDKDNGTFKIGAITPSLTYDLRNSQVNPVKGAFFNLSTEFANPYFLSQKTSDLTVNYYKFVSRNRFYVPYKNGTVAISLVGGVQENLAKDIVKDANGNAEKIEGKDRTEGYIPNIKVFRLTGMDIVRGFSDEEINQLPNGRDISRVRVQNLAYLTNLKIEPRYFINDNFIGGVFYDAGRVFVNNVDMGDLRDSVGVTFKILTPVGTLDFDYGIKLLRKTKANGRLEDPGRFHVSIGFF